MSKWVLSRVGLINFWYYQNQIFEFADGKMLLRGANGSGKSLTMQSLFPVLLDGVTASYRLDSFGSRSRRMEDYLLGEKEVSGRQDGTGYLFVEYKQKERDEYLTCGIGMSARRGASLKKWFFALEDNSRIGQDFSLWDRVNEQERRPFTKRILRNRIEGHGRILETPGEYKQYVNDHVFGFDSIEQYDELIALLINLRSPKLSKEFRPTVIYEILRNSLPKLKDDELLPLSQTIEKLDGHRERIEEISVEIRELNRFANQYKRLHEEVLGQIATRWLDYDKQKMQQTKRQEELEKNLQETSYQQKEAEEKQEKGSIRLEILENKIEELSHHESFSLVKKGQELQEELSRLQGQITATEKELTINQERLTSQKERYDKYELELENKLSDMSDLLVDNEQYLEMLSLTELDGFYTPRMQEGSLSDADFNYWKKEVRQKDAHFQKMGEELKNLTYVKEKLKNLEHQKGQCQQELDQLSRDLNQWQETYRYELDQWKSRLDRWHETSPIEMSDQQYGQILYLMDQLAEERFFTADILEPLHQAYEEALLEKQRAVVPIEQRILTYQTQQEQFQTEKAEWEKMKLPEPPRSQTRLENREKLTESSDDWIPFYRAVDFKKDISRKQRDVIEGVLYASGILDALISPKELVLSEDVRIQPNPQFFTTTLEDYLETQPELSEEMTALTQDILQTILLDDPKEGLATISLNGTYAIGPLKGAMREGYQASFIGAASQERFRQEKIDELTTQLAALDQLIEKDQAAIEVLHDQTNRIKDSYKERPQGSDVFQALKEIDRMTNHYEDKEKTYQLYVKQVEIATKEKDEIYTKLQKNSRSDAFSLTIENYETARKYTQNYRENIEDSYGYFHQSLSLRDQLQDTHTRIDELKEDESRLYDTRAEQKSYHEKTRGSLNENKKQQALVHADEIKAELSQAIHEQKELKATDKKLQVDLRTMDRQKAQTQERYDQLKINLAIVVEGEELWQRLFQKESQRNQLEVDNLKSLAKKQRRDIDGKKIRNLETNFLQGFNYVNEQLRDYQPRLENESNIELTEEQRTRFAEIEGYNNFRIPYFEAEQERQNIFYLQEQLGSQQETLQALLVKEDKELFEKIILDSIGKILRQRIEQAIKWVKKMNELLQNQENSSGLTLSIVWKELASTSEKDLGTRELLRLLRKDPRILTPEDIEAMTTHFQEKVHYAQEQLQLDPDESGTLFQAISKVLDYREWFSFELRFKRANEGYQWKPLSDNQFNIFSGGEKAIAMYLPLFAAVYSRYQEARPSCPYLITLDEAFAGIDDLNIEQLFKACEQLDFNYIMNSQALYGEYATVKNLMTYQLVRPQNASLVSAIQYLWNGKQRRLVTDGKDAK